MALECRRSTPVQAAAAEDMWCGGGQGHATHAFILQCLVPRSGSFQPGVGRNSAHSSPLCDGSGCGAWLARPTGTWGCLGGHRWLAPNPTASGIFRQPLVHSDTFWRKMAAAAAEAPNRNLAEIRWKLSLMKMLQHIRNIIQATWRRCDHVSQPRCPHVTACWIVKSY